MLYKQAWQEKLPKGSVIYSIIWERTRLLHASFYMVAYNHLVSLDGILPSCETATRTLTEGKGHDFYITTPHPFPITDIVQALGELVWDDPSAFKHMELT